MTIIKILIIFKLQVSFKLTYSANMKKGNYLTTILQSSKTVFSIQDVAMLWKDQNTDAARVRLSYYVTNGDLYRIRRGIYAKNSKYDRLELATRVFTPSYVSFETVLAKEGLIFQYQTNITVTSYLTREIIIDEQTYTYKKIKDTVLANSEGVENQNETSVATKERAFLDTLYTNTNYHFDNLRSLDWDIVHRLLPIYENKRMTKVVNQLFGQSKTS